MFRKLFVVTTVSAVVSPAIAAAEGPATGYYHGPHMWEWGWAGFLLGPLMMIVFLSVIIVAIFWLVRALGGTTSTTATGPVSAGRTPTDILKERFARGEIDKEEFQERSKLLEH